MKRIRKPLDQVSLRHRQRRAPASNTPDSRGFENNSRSFAGSDSSFVTLPESLNNHQEQDNRIRIRGDLCEDSQMAGAEGSAYLNEPTRDNSYSDDSLSDCEIKEEIPEVGSNMHSKQNPQNPLNCFVQNNVSCQPSPLPPPKEGGPAFPNLDAHKFHNNVQPPRAPHRHHASGSVGSHQPRVPRIEDLLRAMEERIEARASERHRQLLERLQRVEESVRRIECGEDRQGTRSNLFERPPGFPLMTIEDFHEFEQAGTQRHQDLRQYLVFVGGHTLREALNQFLKETMGDQLIREFSWWGKKTGPSSAPRALFNSKLAQTFYEAVCRCKNFTRPSRAEYVSHMKEVVRAAKQRGRNVKLREKKSVEIDHHELAMQLFPDPGELGGEVSDSSSSETR